MRALQERIEDRLEGVGIDEVVRVGTRICQKMSRG